MEESEHRMKVLEEAISHLYEDIHKGVNVSVGRSGNKHSLNIFGPG